MKGIRLFAVLGLLAVGLFSVLTAPPSRAGSRVIREHILFGGANTDSTEQASIWIPVFGASRVYIRTWTSHAAWAIDNADSMYSDSVTTFKLVLTDTLANYKAATDSIVVDAAVAAAGMDTAKTMITALPLPINKELRDVGNGAGLITLVYPPNVTRTSLMGIYPDASGIIAKKFLRVRVTPLRRSTGYRFSSTSGGRVNGLKGLKMRAYVVFDNQ